MLCFASQNVPRMMDGEGLPRDGCETSRLYRDHGQIGPAVEQIVQASFSQLGLSKFEGGLAGKLR